MSVSRFTGNNASALPGGLGTALLNCNSIPEVRALVPLPEDAQKLIDDAVVRVGMDRLVIVSDLMEAGLTFPLSDPLSVMQLQWDKVSRAGYAQRSMIPKTRGENQLIDREPTSIPIYATFDDFMLNIRTMRAAARAGVPLDTSHIEEATRNVNEAIEDAAINGAGLTSNGFTAYGLLNAPNANTQAYASNEAWDASGHDGEDIVGDLKNMIGKLHDDKMFGPYNLYVPTSYGIKLTTTDYKAQSALTIQQRIEEIQAGGRGIRVRVADQLGANRTVLVQMTSNVVDVVVGQQPIPLSWDRDGAGWERQFVVLAFMVPRVKDTYSDQSGICNGYTT